VDYPLLKVSTIRNRGVEQDVEAILSPFATDEGVLMARDKIRLDTVGDPSKPKPAAAEIEVELYEGGTQPAHRVGSFRGDADVAATFGSAWELIDQGIFGDSGRPPSKDPAKAARGAHEGGLIDTDGYTFMVRWNGWGPGTTSAAIRVSHGLDASGNRAWGPFLIFPRAD